MSAKRSLPAYPLLTAQALGASFNSPPTKILYIDNVGYEIDVSSASSLNGVFTIQVSASYDEDDQGNVIKAGIWTTVQYPNTDTNVSATVTSNGSVYFDLNQLSAPWARLVWTSSDGTGTANVFVCGKTMGG